MRQRMAAMREPPLRGVAARVLGPGAAAASCEPPPADGAFLLFLAGPWRMGSATYDALRPLHQVSTQSQSQSRCRATTQARMVRVVAVW